MKEEKFQHVQKPLTGEDKGEFWNLRGEQSNRWSEAKQREFTTEFIAKQHVPAEKWLAVMPTAASGGWVLRLPGRTSVLTALKIF